MYGDRHGSGMLHGTGALGDVRVCAHRLHPTTAAPALQHSFQRKRSDHLCWPLGTVNLLDDRYAHRAVAAESLHCSIDPRTEQRREARHRCKDRGSGGCVELQVETQHTLSIPRNRLAPDGCSGARHASFKVFDTETLLCRTILSIQRLSQTIVTIVHRRCDWVCAAARATGRRDARSSVSASLGSSTDAPVIAGETRAGPTESCRHTGHNRQRALAAPLSRHA